MPLPEKLEETHRGTQLIPIIGEDGYQLDLSCTAMWNINFIQPPEKCVWLYLLKLSILTYSVIQNFQENVPYLG